jgi:hypothetical protein
MERAIRGGSPSSMTNMFRIWLSPDGRKIYSRTQLNPNFFARSNHRLDLVRLAVDRKNQVVLQHLKYRVDISGGVIEV